MQTTSAVLSLFTRDLELKSAGNPGRALMELIQATGLDTLQASTPLELGLKLGLKDHRDELVGHYLAVGSSEPRLRTLAIVAAGPTIEEVAIRNAGPAPRSEFKSELCVVLLELLATISDVEVTERRIWLAQHAVSAARAATRSPRGGSGASLESDYRGIAETLEVPAAEHHPLAEALDRVLEAGVITQEEWEFTKGTRSTYGGLQEMAEDLQVSYAALQKRRRRIELRLAAAINAELAK